MARGCGVSVDWARTGLSGGLGLRLRLPPTLIAIAGGGALTVLHVVCRTGSPAQSAVDQLAGTLSAVAIAIGIRRHRPSRALLWWLLCAAVFLWALGDAIFSYPIYFGRETPYPSLADAVYLAGYACLLAMIVSLIWRRARIGIGGLLDVLVLGGGVALLLWAFAIEPITGTVNSGADVLSCSQAAPRFSLLATCCTASLL